MTDEEFMLDTLCDGDPLALISIPRAIIRSLRADNAALREALSLIEMETRDGGQWGLRDVNEAVRIALETP